MDEILAKYTDKAEDRGDGLRNKECPLCGQVVFELDMESYHETGTKRVVECCTSCREDFEADSGIQLDSDVLDCSRFARLWSRANELASDRDDGDDGIHEGNADVIARALGGEAWHSGGGVWLVLLRRQDGTLLVVSDEAICEYLKEKDFDRGKARTSMPLR